MRKSRRAVPPAVYTVLLDGEDDPLYQLLGLFATREAAHQFASEVAGRFDRAVEVGQYEMGWRYDEGSVRVDLSDDDPAS